MASSVVEHYSGSSDLTAAISAALDAAGIERASTTTATLAPVDEFHIRGRAATVEIAAALRVDDSSSVLDIGSGLGGPARAIAELTGAHVTGVDLTPAFAEAATAMSEWTGLGDRTDFVVGDATVLEFADAAFDAALTVHVAMNIPDKGALYREARRILRPGGRFVVYDVLRGAGGPLHYPVPWARDASTSFLASPDEMVELLQTAGFTVVEQTDSSADSLAWFEAMTARLADSGPPPVTFATFLGEDFPQMARNQVVNLREHAISTVTFVCEG
jgi:ubiquinone/menaquinone biosynthesis C-methylase UbiE